MPTAPLLQSMPSTPGPHVPGAYPRTPIPLADFLELPAPTPGETAPTPGETAPTQRDTPLPPRTKGQLTPYPRDTPPDDADEGDALENLHEIVEEDEGERTPVPRPAKQVPSGPRVTSSYFPYGQHPPALTPVAEMASPAPHDTTPSASTVLPTIHSASPSSATTDTATTTSSLSSASSVPTSPESATSDANAKPSASPTRRALIGPTSVGSSPPPSAFSAGAAASP
ncbi:hypothetical protein C8J57DRAFT_1642846, partial [Mycena rebaudengoi]